ncbi:MAG: type II secretion system protein GspN [Bdellovibrionota bacterium]|nr:type II secretion system protein GspN [Bdellovibrionota bacterium]
MRKKIILEDDLKDEIYSEFPLSKISVFFLAIILIILGFSLNFPLKEKVSAIILTELKKNKACPVLFESLDFNILNPGLIINNVLVSGRCFQNPSSNLTFKDIKVNFSLPSLSPPGLKFKTEISKGRSLIRAFPALSIASSKVDIDPSSKIIIHDFSEKKSGKFDLKGDVKISGDMSLKGSKVQGTQFTLKSNNITLPAQTVNNFNIPLIPLGKLILKAKMNRRGLLTIQSFQAGSDASPVLLEVEGSMKVNQRYIGRSTYDLKGKINFSEQFYKKDFPILNLFLSGKQKDSKGYFSFTLRGSAMSPRFKLR